MLSKIITVGGALLLALKISDTINEWQKMSRKRERFLSDIQINAKRYDVSPFVLSALIWKESKFMPDAIGGAGEVGLGQTRTIALDDLKTNYTHFPNVDITDVAADPSLQIEAAAAYLRLQTRRMGNIFDGLRAYNAGQAGASNPSVSINYAVDIMTMAGADWALSIFGGGNV